jgi:hypothetical protein
VGPLVAGLGRFCLKTEPGSKYAACGDHRSPYEGTVPKSFRAPSFSAFYSIRSPDTYEGTHSCDRIALFVAFQMVRDAVVSLAFWEQNQSLLSNSLSFKKSLQSILRNFFCNANIHIILFSHVSSLALVFQADTHLEPLFWIL